MPLLWLRFATILYGVGLLYALLLLTRRGDWLSRIAVPAVGFGMVLHFVSLTEIAVLNGYLMLLTIRHAESALALLIGIAFMYLYVRYRTTSPGIFMFPLMFFLTFISEAAQRPPVSPSPMIRSWLIPVHVGLLLIGYAALFLSFISSLLYIVQSRNLKAKAPSSLFSRLPALEVIDQIGYKSLLFGFPFMTFGLIAGSVVAVSRSKVGAEYFLDPKVLLSILMWGVYMVLLYTRWNSGWRGRRAAYLATFAFVAAVCAWAANAISTVHMFINP